MLDPDQLPRPHDIDSGNIRGACVWRGTTCVVKYSDSNERQTGVKNTLKRLLLLFPILSLSGTMLAGVLLWGGFNWSLEVTNTEQFCTSCHEMRDNPYVELKKTVHFQNRSGVRATCPDCHVPKEWVYKVVRKIRATGELYHWMIGTVSTPEKFEARRPELANHVWSMMKETDSRECRNCHKNSSMQLATQKPQAAKMHEMAENWGKTCIDCHKGIAHNLPKGVKADKVMDELHARFEDEKVNCRDCHQDMAGPPVGDDGWAKE